MNIAIGGEGDAPAKRCGATMKLTSGIADKWDDDWTDGEGHDMSDYKGAYTVVDSDYDGQTVVGTPMTVNTKTYTPIVLGITKGLYDHICELYSLTVATYIEDVVFSIYSADEEETLFDLSFISLYKDANNNCAIIGLAEVDDTNSTVLCEDNWYDLLIPNPESGKVEYYDFFNDKSFAPTSLTFTPAEQSEGE